MLKMHLRHPRFEDLGIVLEDQLQKPKKEYKNSKKQEKPDITIETKSTKPIFHSLQLMMRLKSYPEQLLTEYYVSKNLQYLVIQNVMDVSVDSLQWATKYYHKDTTTKKQE